MDVKTLKEMASVANNLHRKSARINKLMTSYNSHEAMFVLEAESHLEWLKGKIDELVTECKSPESAQPYTTGREL